MKITITKSRVLSIIASLSLVIFVSGKMITAYEEFSNYISAFSWIAFVLAILSYLIIKLTNVRYSGTQNKLFKLFYFLQHSFFIFLITYTTIDSGMIPLILNYFIYVSIELVAEFSIKSDSEDNPNDPNLEPEF